MSIPSDLVPVGHISGAYGINGWVRIKAYSKDGDALLHAKSWWLDKPELHDVDVMQCKVHGDEVVAQLVGVANRDAAEALKGSVIQISRRHFPALADGEFYWVDLIGYAVENAQGHSLGSVIDLMDNGAHPILRVVPDGVANTPKPMEILIPFVDHFVMAVDQALKKITVDWSLDY